MVSRALGVLSSSGRARRIGFAAVVIVYAIILSLPAILYAYRVPGPTNALSALMAIGFFGAVVTLMRRIWLQVALGLPILILNVVEIVHILVYGSLIALGGLEAVLHADPHEAREFVSDNPGVFLLGAGAVPGFAALVWVRKHLDDLRLRQRLALAGTMMMLPTAALAANLWIAGSTHDVYVPTRFVDHLVSHLGGNPLTQTISGLAATIASRAELSSAREVRNRFRFNARRDVALADRELYVVVIGESSRRRSWSVYGYGRPTSPRSAATGNLFAFTDAVSTGTVTTPSVTMAMTLAMPETLDVFYRTRSVVSAFREAGFRTYWLSNQGAHRSVVGSEIALMMEEADVVRTSNFGSWTTVHDDKLLPLLDEAIRDPAPRKLIVLHTMGSHPNYRQRIPAGWTLGADAPPVRNAHGFAEISDEQAAIIHDYDLTISYTDWFLHQVIERHRRDGAYGATVYFSDHGQRLYDDRDFGKGHGFRQLKPEDVEVPLLVWLSDALLQRHPERRAAIVANTGKPVSTGRMTESLLDLAAIDIGRPVAPSSFFSAAFRPEQRSVLMTDKSIVACCGTSRGALPASGQSASDLAPR